MINTALHKFLELKDPSLWSGNTSILCNQISYDFRSGKYLFEILNERDILKSVFIPEHGLFAEFQDQVKLDQTNIYRFFRIDVPMISLYGKEEGSIFISKKYLENIQTFIIDIQDVGSRYYTYLSTINNLFLAIKNHTLQIKVYVIDHPNPAGRQVEGTCLPKEYTSFVGIKGLPHRHGLTIGEMCKYLKYEMDADFDLKIIPFSFENFDKPFEISPSPNFPSLTTAQLYSGQCLFEGTILSEGRGTTKPFEIIGAPFLKWETLLKIRNELFSNYPIFKNKIALRPLKFIPTDNKFKDEVCVGFQLHMLTPEFHSLLFSLILLHYIQKYTKLSIWKIGKYEFESEKTAIEILAGDKKILDCLKNSGDFKALIPHLQREEILWIKKVKKHLIYPDELTIQKII